MDHTHGTNALDWRLFTLMIRSSYCKWIPCAHMLSSSEDGDIVARFLNQVKTWCMGEWRPRFFLTDDSASEQRAVRMAFNEPVPEGTFSIESYLCRKQCEATLKRNLSAHNCRACYLHLINALYYRTTQQGGEEEICKAMEKAPDDKKKDYIRQHWWRNRRLWAHYARQHSPILLQVPTTNPVESWHSFKKAPEDKLTISKFSLLGIASHVLLIGNEWELRDNEEATRWRISTYPEAQNQPELAAFPVPIQKHLIGQIKKAKKDTANGRPSSIELSENYLIRQQVKLPGMSLAMN